MNQDPETIRSLSKLESLKGLSQNRITGVKTVLVVLSAYGMLSDVEAIRRNILFAYPDATVFFRATSGKSVGPESFKAIDLLIDLTGPGQRQPWFYSKKLRKIARFAVGRNAGLFRKKIYDRIFNEKDLSLNLPRDFLDRERAVQKKIFELAGVPLVPHVPISEVGEDKGHVIALEISKLS